MQTQTTNLPYTAFSLAELQKLQGDFVCLSGEYGDFTILGYNPVIEIQLWHGDVAEHLVKQDELLNYLKDLVTEETPTLPFQLGLLGFFSYDFGNLLYGIQNLQETNSPLSYWILPQTVITWSHTNKTLTKLEHKFTDAEITYLKSFFPDQAAKQTSSCNFSTELISNLSEAAYNQKLDKIKEQLINGESYQVNFAQEFRKKQSLDPIKTFFEISKINPSNYQALVNTKHFSLISNSPELLISKTEDKLITKPIKGTCRRTHDKEIDQQNLDMLKTNPKTISELTMIVDMSRNDLAQISKAGTIKVEAHQQIQELSHVFHTYSTVVAKAKENLKLSDVIHALFPGASVTGCPKKRTMEIINELEPSARGAYCGSAGYINYNLDLALNILIRTIWYSNNCISLHSGGGIVIDSTSKNEYTETLDKASALLSVLQN